MEKEYPSEIAGLINELRFADAIEACKTYNLNDAAIRELVHEQVQDANTQFENGNAQRSIDLYITTIGVIEPSNVLCRFFVPHLTKYLTEYLIELHKRGYANEDHTRLLFNMFHHAEEREHLDDFISYLRQAKMR